MCVSCNTGLGDLTDDLVLLTRLIDYLKGDLWLIQRESPGVYRLCS
ncbi:endonuclease domain-containing protein [Protofrankia symbiont of Coriaria ruscifolia]|nr:endonuclease domain-containing protein [Protofrankia symbiont of Coriaria ruscifolia]